MKNVFTSSVAAIALAGAMATTATPAQAGDTVRAIGTAGRIYNDIKRNENARIRSEQQYEVNMARIEANREKDRQRNNEHLDSQANNRCNQSERNQIQARAQDYRYTKTAPRYESCTPQRGPYNAVVMHNGFPVRTGNRPDFAAEAAIRAEESPSRRTDFATASTTAPPQDDCFTRKLPNGNTQELCSNGKGAYVPVIR